jgi:hypothetical protein
VEDRPHDETDLVSKIVAALTGHLGIDLGRPYSPGSSRQALSDLCNKDAFCDIIARISDSTVLPLEVKVCTEKEGREGKAEVLRYFKEEQRMVYRCLFKAGVLTIHQFSTPAIAVVRAGRPGGF